MTFASESFFDPATFTVTYLVWDKKSGEAVVIDPVLDFDPAAGRTSTESSEKLLDVIAKKDLKVTYILETHVHADHLTAAQFVKAKTGAKMAIGNQITLVQETFAKLYNMDVACDGSQFDILLEDGHKLPLGGGEIEVMHTPGHTPACVSYHIGDMVFVGDTIFMPDFGSARCDFPHGDAATLYDSVQKLLALPAETRMFVGHDYAPGDRDYEWETTVAKQKAGNIHMKDGNSKSDFVKMREQRDSQLAMPKLLLPAIQINMCAGQLPAAENNGTAYVKIPLNVL